MLSHEQGKWGAIHDGGNAPVFGLFATNDVRERGRPGVLSRTPEDSLEHLQDPGGQFSIQCAVGDLASTRPSKAFSDCRASRAARKVRCRSMFSA